MYTFWIFSPKRVPKVVCCQESDIKVKISRQPNKGMWGVYPKAMACNVEGLCPDLLSEKCTFRKGILGAFSQHTLTQIKI